MNNLNFKKLLSIASVIFIGAIGSGLWEIFLKDASFSAADVFINLISKIYTGYLDKAFHGVGKVKVGDLISRIPGLVMILALIVSPPFIYYKFSKILNIEINFSTESINDSFNFILKYGKTVRALMTAAYLVMSIIYISLLIESIIQATTKSYIETSIDIISPSIDNKLKMELQQEYRSITNKENAVNFINKIITIANKNEIKIFTPQIPGIDINEITSINNKLDDK